MSDDSYSARISAACSAEARTILDAAWTHDIAALRRLLDEPGKASVQDPITRETPLHAAIRGAAAVISRDAEAHGASAAAREHTAAAAAAAAADTKTKPDDSLLEAAKTAVAELLQWGAIWNDVDDHSETPGCVALRLLGRDSELYTMCVAAGVRAEMLFGALGQYEELGSDDDDDNNNNNDGDNDGEECNGEAKTAPEGDQLDASAVENFELELEAVARNAAILAGDGTAYGEGVVSRDPPSSGYLCSELRFDTNKLVDEGSNAVMMAWETDIMRYSVVALLMEDGFSHVPQLVSGDGATNGANGPSISGSSSCDNKVKLDSLTSVEIPALPHGKRILNIGLGMGIIDGFFADTQPAKHHIIEAHPSVVEWAKSAPLWQEYRVGPWSGSDGEDNADGSAKSDSVDRRILAGRWQEIVPTLLAAGEEYDAIYFDTFGEDYAELKRFFTDYVPALLDQDGRFGFFNGLGADRQICYDVYQQVVELHLCEAGFDIDWVRVPVDLEGMAMDKEGSGTWEGVIRRYWTLDGEVAFCNFPPPPTSATHQDGDVNHDLTGRPEYRLPIVTFMG